MCRVDSTSSVGDAKLGKDVGDMILYSGHLDREAFGNNLIGGPFGQQLKNLNLALGKFVASIQGGWIVRTRFEGLADSFC